MWSRSRQVGTGTPDLGRRVTVGVLGLVAVLLGCLFAVVYLILGARLHADLRTRLLDRAAVAQLLDGRVPDQRLVDDLTGDGVTASLNTVGGALTGVPDPAAPRPHAGGRPAAPPHPADAVITTRGDQLSVAVPLRDGRLTVTASQRDIDATLHRLLVLGIVGGLTALVVLAVALRLTVKLALRPLATLTELATAIAGGARGERLRPSRPVTDLGRTATAFDAMLDELETAVTEARTAATGLQEFLADASHELRTPVAGMSLSAELLLTEVLSDPARERLAAGLVGQSRRIGRLVDDLMTSARLAEPHITLHPAVVDLPGLAAVQVEHCQLLAPDLTVTVHCPDSDSCRVLGDPIRLGQVISNLLDNARHATPPGGTITVTIGASHDEVTLLVTDTGIGVLAADRERIFERFVRLEPRAAGNGLGLSICRSIAHAHGGSLRCQPTADLTGARFELTLPVAHRPTSGSAAALTAHGSARCP